jgi:hypothetical protein
MLVREDSRQAVVEKTHIQYLAGEEFQLTSLRMKGFIAEGKQITMVAN